MWTFWSSGGISCKFKVNNPHAESYSDLTGDDPTVHFLGLVEE